MKTRRFDQANPLDVLVGLWGLAGLWLIRRQWVRRGGDALADLGGEDE